MHSVSYCCEINLSELNPNYSSFHHHWTSEIFKVLIFHLVYIYILKYNKLNGVQIKKNQQHYLLNKGEKHVNLLPRGQKQRIIREGLWLWSRTACASVRWWWEGVWMKGCRWRGLMGLPLAAAPNADFQVILRWKSHAAHL